MATYSVCANQIITLKVDLSFDSESNLELGRVSPELMKSVAVATYSVCDQIIAIFSKTGLSFDGISTPDLGELVKSS